MLQDTSRAEQGGGGRAKGGSCCAAPLLHCVSVLPFSLPRASSAPAPRATQETPLAAQGLPLVSVRYRRLRNRRAQPPIATALAPPPKMKMENNWRQLSSGTSKLPPLLVSFHVRCSAAGGADDEGGQFGGSCNCAAAGVTADTERLTVCLTGNGCSADEGEEASGGCWHEPLKKESAKRARVLLCLLDCFLAAARRKFIERAPGRAKLEWTMCRGRRHLQPRSFWRVAV